MEQPINFKPIKPKKVSTQIADQIRTSILAGEFAPGDKLPPERELAEMFGVSRPSVREALKILASSGCLRFTTTAVDRPNRIWRFLDANNHNNHT